MHAFCVRACAGAGMYVCAILCVCLCVYVFVCKYACMYVYIYVCVWVCVCVLCMYGGHQCLVCQNAVNSCQHVMDFPWPVTPH